MGEAVVGAFLLVLLEKLANGEVVEYIGRLKGVNKKVLEKWTTTLTEIEEVLNDAEDKQLTQPRVESWLDDLKDLAYDVEDILDTFATKMLKRRIEKQQGSTKERDSVVADRERMRQGREKISYVYVKADLC